MSEAMWVEKLPLAVGLALADGSRLQGTLYLAPSSPRHSGPQTVAELMGETEPLVPFAPAGGGFVLVGRAAVAGADQAAGEAGDLVVRVPARLTLAGGHRVAGEVLGEAGAGSRLSDLLNTPDPWVRVSSGDRLWWVAKAHLVWVEAAGEGADFGP
ncbi:MAG: hypothetical protein ACYDA8_20595 [Deferrisomatales bacterium]